MNEVDTIFILLLGMYMLMYMFLNLFLTTYYNKKLILAKTFRSQDRERYNTHFSRLITQVFSMALVGILMLLFDMSFPEHIVFLVFPASIVTSIFEMKIGVTIIYGSRITPTKYIVDESLAYKVGLARFSFSIMMLVSIGVFAFLLN